MNNLYRSVENLQNEHFSDDLCKKTLLSTRNSSSDACRKLKVNIDDTEPVKYYLCPNFSKGHSPEGLSTFYNSPCVCGSKISRELPLDQDGANVDHEKGVFLKGAFLFMVTDDLQVMPLSTETTFGLLKDLGVKATQALEKKTVIVSHDEVYRLLKHSLFSKTSLTGTFLQEQMDLPCRIKSIGLHEFCPTKKDDMNDVQTISFDLIVRKSNQKAIYAESGSDFVIFLISMLTFPLGSVLKLLGRASSLGCIRNMYRSLREMNTCNCKYMKSEHHKQLLLSPKIAPQYDYTGQVLKVTEASPPSYFYTFIHCRGSTVHRSSLSTNYIFQPPNLSTRSYSAVVNLVKVQEFVKGPNMFMVTDDLVVTPYSSIAAITMLEQLKIPINDVEKRVVNFGYKEALQMLEASITSKTALTSVLSGFTTKTVKQEVC